MVGGKKSFRGGGYRGTPIEEILPVDLSYDMKGSVAPPFFEGPVKVKQTKTGRHHPILAGEKQITFLQGFNTSLKIKKDAHVLLEHAIKGNTHGKYPIISVIEVGNGRTMSMGSGSFWRENFLSAGQGDSVSFYNRFWNNTLKWLTFDPELNRIKIDLQSTPEKKGEKVSFGITVLNKHWQPSWELDLKAKLTTPDNKNKKIRLHRSTQVGTYTASFDPHKNGIYKLKVKTSKETAYGFVSVGELGKETEYLSTDGNLMKALSELSGGQFYNSTEQKSFPLSFDAEERYLMKNEKIVSLWNNWYLLTLTIALLAGEWFWRRKKGLQ